jgi:hypothetical protein
MSNYNIFVSINYKGDKSEELYKKTKVNNFNINSNKYLIGGGIYNSKKGGKIVFTAKTLQEINQITKKKPLLKDNIPMKYSIAFIPKKIY